ncbi:hypothetical protein KGF57_003345 [Candida theae]|uniref:Uncharacterized protein n=1 Tax=Candida theae TaxID=1198502 RepID=A0AAD5FY17_9ASCO|nr:uncharacterized protein KGF57_003345 [Candida theae]KAI5957651.1 hypothetical protein KGF57_003345 [Candida theae]
MTPYNHTFSSNKSSKIQLDELSDQECCQGEDAYNEKELPQNLLSRTSLRRASGLALFVVMILSSYDYIGEVGTFIWLTIVYCVTVGSEVITNLTASARSVTDFRLILANLIHSYNAVLIIVAHWILVVHIGLDLVALTSYAVLMFFSFTFFPYIEHIVN